MAFHFHDWLRKKGKLGIVWLAAVDEKQIQKREWLSENLIQTCGFIRDYIENEDKVRAKQKVVLGCIAENLAYGASVILRKKVQAFLDEILKGSDYFDRVERLKDRPAADDSDGDDGPDDQPNGDEPRRKKPRFDIDLHIKKNIPTTLPKSMFNKPEDFGKIEMFRSRLLYDVDEVSDFEFYQPPPIDEQPHIAPLPDITMVEVPVPPQPDAPIEDLQEGVDEVFLLPKDEKSDINVTASDTMTSVRELPAAGDSLPRAEEQTPKGPVAPEAVDEEASARASLMPIEEEDETSASRHMPPPPSPPKPKVPRRRRPRRDVDIELTDERLRNRINMVDDIPPLIDRWADIRRRVDVINVRDVLRLPGRRELGRNDIFCRVWDNRLLRPVNELEDVEILLPEGIPSPPHIEREPQPALPEMPPALSPPVRPVATVIEEIAAIDETAGLLPLSPSHPEQPPAVPSLPLQPPVARSPPVQPPIALSPPVQPVVAPSLPLQPPVAPSPLVQPPAARSPPVQPPIALSPPVQPPSAKPTSAGPGPLPNGNGSPPHPSFPSPPPPQPPIPGPLPNGNGRPPYPSPPPPMSPQPPADLPEDEGRIIIDTVRYKVFEELDMARRIIECIDLLNEGEKLTFEILAPPKGRTNRLGASIVFKHLLEFSRRRWLNVEQLDEFGTIEVTIRDNGMVSKLGGRPYTSPPSSLSVVPSDVDVSQLSFPDD